MKTRFCFLLYWNSPLIPGLIAFHRDNHININNDEALEAALLGPAAPPLREEDLDSPTNSTRSDVMGIVIVSNDERLRPFGPEIEYNGRDAFEFGAVGCVMAPIDATVMPEEAQQDASFTFKHLEELIDSEERTHALENTSRLIEQLQRAGGRFQHVQSKLRQLESPMSAGRPQAQETPIARTMNVGRISPAIRFGTGGGGESQQKCGVCMKTIYANVTKLVIDAMKFHRACAKCSTCQCQLTLGNFATADDLLLCKTHLLESFARAGGKYAGDTRFQKSSQGYHGGGWGIIRNNGDISDQGETKLHFHTTYCVGSCTLMNRKIHHIVDHELKLDSNTQAKAPM